MPAHKNLDYSLGIRHFHPKFWLQWFSILLTAVLVILPWQVRKKLGYLLGDLLYKSNARRVDIARINMHSCLKLKGSDLESAVRKHMRYLGLSLIESLYLLWAPKQRITNRLPIERITGLKHYQAIPQDQGILLVTAHYVYLEFLVSLTPILPFTSGAREHTMEIYNWFNARMRRRYTNGNVDPRNPFVVSQVLRDGKNLMHFPDQDPGKKGSVFAPFFGVATATNAAYRMAAKRAKARCLFIDLSLDEATGNFSVSIEPFDQYLEIGDKHQAATMVNERLEQAIGKQPSAWLWCHRRFKTRPAPDPTPVSYS